MVCTLPEKRLLSSSVPGSIVYWRIEEICLTWAVTKSGSVPLDGSSDGWVQGISNGTNGCGEITARRSSLTKSVCGSNGWHCVSVALSLDTGIPTIMNVIGREILHALVSHQSKFGYLSTDSDRIRDSGSSTFDQNTSCNDRAITNHKDFLWCAIKHSSCWVTC